MSHRDMKENVVISWYRAKLDDLCEGMGRPVSAGELAIYMGCTRPTAKRYLSKLVNNGVAHREYAMHHNHAMKAVYKPRDMCFHK